MKIYIDSGQTNLGQNAKLSTRNATAHLAFNLAAKHKDNSKHLSF